MTLIYFGVFVLGMIAGVAALWYFFREYTKGITEIPIRADTVHVFHGKHRKDYVIDRGYRTSILLWPKRRRKKCI